MMATFCPLSIDTTHATTCSASLFLGFGITALRTPSSSSSLSRSPISFSLLSSSSTPSASHVCSHVNSCKFTGVNKNSKYRKFGYYAMSTTLCDFTMSKSIAGGDNHPDHLLVLVHGILASPSDWTYFEAELKRRLGRSFFIYASSSNAYTKTFDGIDASGRRLAEEVSQVVKKMESLKKISFLAHSLGGLFARHAVGILYSARNMNTYEGDDPSKIDGFQHSGTIAGLEPINFITLATPHLGVRGRKQLPFLLGVPILEKLAAPIAPLLVGRTGSQLFLTDGKPSRPPLLLRMASDCDDGKFISALGAFRSRILYANPPRQSLDGYKHVVDVEYCPPVSSEGPHYSLKAAKAKEAARNSPSIQNTVEYHEIVEEEMISGLQRLGWKKVDVSFHSAVWPFFAHNNIHVKNEWFHNAGFGVVAHVADSLKQQESCLFVSSSL
ncbi:Lipid droplet phospholipase 1-like protein [Drosera capensis]